MKTRFKARASSSARSSASSRRLAGRPGSSCATLRSWSSPLARFSGCSRRSATSRSTTLSTSSPTGSAAEPAMTAQTTAPAGAQWFALHTLSGQENKVKTYIERFKTAKELDDSIFEVLLPTEVVSEVKNGKKSSKVRKLYPGYVFIQMRLFGEDKKLINKPWYFVREVAGVIGFVGGEHPAPLRQSEIDEIRARIEAANGKEVPKVQYSVGEEVKINDGPFANLNGRIDEIDPDRGKLKIYVSIFGRFTPVELEYWQVQRSTDWAPGRRIQSNNGEEDPRLHPSPAPRRRGQSLPPGRPRAGRAGRQHHGVLQGVQRQDEGPERDDPPRDHHGLRGQELHVHPEVAPGLRSPEEGGQHRERLGEAQPGQGGQGEPQAASRDLQDQAEGPQCAQRRGRHQDHSRHGAQHGHRSRRLKRNTI